MTPTRRAVLGHASYLPSWRVDAGEAGWRGRGSRAVAGFDEDSTTMAVEAAGKLLAALGDGPAVDTVTLATTRPAYTDKTNAAAVHAALGLSARVPAVDAIGSVRSGASALSAAFEGRGTHLVILSDIRSGEPGSAEEVEGGDGAVAFLVGDRTDGAITTLRGQAARTVEVLDRWRTSPGGSLRAWEQTFVAEALVPAATGALTGALEDAGLRPDDLTQVVVTSPSTRTAKQLRRILPGASGGTLDLADSVGYSGVADLGLLLGEAIGAAGPGDHIGVVLASDGAVAFVLTVEDPGRVRPASIDDLEQPRPIRNLDYATLLRWRGELARDPARRPEPGRPLAPASFRNRTWKFGLDGSRCRCGTIHYPPARICRSCRARDEMSAHGLRGRRGTVATVTTDHLAWSPGPPAVYAIVDIDGGGRVQMAVADAEPGDLRPGCRVDLTFRRLATQGEVHNYFWKARPVHEEQP